MVRPLLLTAGSREDVEPMTALAEALLASPRVESVTYCVQRDHLATLPAHPQLRTTVLPFTHGDIRAALSSVGGGGGVEPGGHADGVLLAGRAELVLAAGRAAACDVVVCSLAGTAVGDLARRSLGAPLVRLAAGADIPSAFFPAAAVDAAGAAAAMARARGGQPERPDAAHAARAEDALRAAVAAAAPRVDAMRARLALPPLLLPELLALVRGDPPAAGALVAAHKALAPSPPDLPERVRCVGPLARAGARPAPALAAFVAAGKAPVVVAFGTCAPGDAVARVSQAVLAGLRAAGVERVVLLPGAAGAGARWFAGDAPADAALRAWAEGRVHVEEKEVGLSWLLPRAEMLICHGGREWVTAALAAGTPLVVAPIEARHVFYAEIARLSGFGVRVGGQGFAAITAEAVEQGVREVRKGAVTKTVRALAKKMEDKGNAAQMAVDFICAAAETGR